MSGFSRVINGVEVFEVGYQQVLDFLKSGRVDLAGGFVMHNTYLIISRHVTFGHLGVISIWSGYTRQEVFMCLPDMYHDLSEMSIPLDYRYCRECEIWHVVDDADLWQVWEHDSAVACKDGGQSTDYHVYDGYKCVMDLVREVPSMLYAVTLVNELDEIVSADWFDDADKWAQAVSFANVNGNRFMSLEHQTGEELGLHIVDDWCCDEGLADGVDVLNAYYRDYRSE